MLFVKIKFDKDDIVLSQVKEVKKKRKKKSGIGRVIATFFITLFALCGAAMVFLIVTAEQLDWKIMEGIFPNKHHSTEQPSGSTYGLVKESNAVGDEYFDDLVFVGDSLTNGMTLLDFGLGYKAYGVNGISVRKALTGSDPNYRYELDNGTYGNAVQAAKERNPGKIYLMFGTNGINFETFENMIADYTEMVELIKAYCPNAKIYIQSIPPVTKGYTKAYPKFKPDRIKEYNGMLLEMAKKLECYYLDSYSALCTESGYLPMEFANADGLHINKKAYEVMFDYIRTHTVS